MGKTCQHIIFMWLYYTYNVYVQFFTMIKKERDPFWFCGEAPYTYRMYTISTIHLIEWNIYKTPFQFPFLILHCSFLSPYFMSYSTILLLFLKSNFF